MCLLLQSNSNNNIVIGYIILFYQLNRAKCVTKFPQLVQLYCKCPVADLILCLAGVVSAGDWRGGEEGNWRRCSVCHHGSRTPTGWTVQPHLLQRATLGGARHKPVVKTEVCQLKLFQAAYLFFFFLFSKHMSRPTHTPPIYASHQLASYHVQQTSASSPEPHISASKWILVLYF